MVGPFRNAARLLNSIKGRPVLHFAARIAYLVRHEWPNVPECSRDRATFQGIQDLSN